MQETLEKIKNSRSAGEVFLAALVRELYRLAADAGLERRIGTRVVLDQPEVAAQVFRDPDTYLKDYGVIAALGDSRFNTDGADWERRRGLTQPVYNAAARGRDWISAIYADEVSRADANMESVCTALTRAAVRAFLTALGIDAPITPFVPFVGELRNLAAELQYASMTEVAPDRIEELRVEASAARHQLRALIGAGSSAQPSWGDAEILMHLLAGIDTTIASLFWAIDRIGVNMEAQQRVRVEIRGSSADTPYLDTFIAETLRYFPPIPFVTRRLARRVELGHHVLDENQLILISIVGLHHSRAHWHEPEQFKASRPEFIDNTYDRRAFQPFLSGPRVCGGMRLAQIEISEGLKALLTNFEFRRSTPEILFDYSLQFRPLGLEKIEVSRL